MSWLRSRSLRLQLAMALAGLVMVSLGFVILGTYAFVAYGEMQFFDSLSPEAQEAYLLDWAMSGTPPLHILQEIALAEEQILYPVYEAELKVVLLFSALAIGLSLPIALWIARRLTAPLEKATASARVIAGGDFSHRLEIPQGSSDEVLSLSNSFTHLAESLQRMEQNVRFTSASVAHELRTPLTVIQGYLQGIRDGVFEADEERLDTMLDRMAALNRLLDDLQTLGLADSGRWRLKKTSVLLGKRLRRLVAWVAARSEGPLVFIDDGEADPERPMNVDVERIEQVVLGLLHNARHHASGEEEIQVRYERKAEEAMITVTDQGPGFSAQALEHACERFWRDMNGPAHGSGTGLGLAVAQAVVEAHGGRIQLANRPEGGASVRLNLPETVEVDEI